MSIPSDVQSVHREHLRDLSQRPNTTVLDVEHDIRNEPWSAARLRGVMESITARVMDTPDTVDDYTLRKTLLTGDNEMLAFQRQHPKFYWLLTDRTVMKEQKSRDAITGMLHVRDEIERGNVTDDHEADAMATRTIIQSLS